MKQTHGFKLRFKGSVEFAFDSQIPRNQAVRQVTAALKLAGLTKADYHIELVQGVVKGRRFRLVTREE